MCILSVYKHNYPFQQASAFIMTYPVNNEIDSEGNGTKRAEAWEKAFIQLAKVLVCFYLILDPHNPVFCRCYTQKQKVLT